MLRMKLPIPTQFCAKSIFSGKKLQTLKSGRKKWGKALPLSIGLPKTRYRGHYEVCVGYVWGYYEVTGKARRGYYEG